MLSKSKEHNINYLCKIIEVKGLRPHPNADRLLVFTVDGNDIITSTQTKEGQLSVYFPLECKICHELLSKNNDYRLAKDETSSTYGMNVDPTDAGGFFDNNGRVKAVKLRTQKSEGYVVPVSYLRHILGDKVSNLYNYIGEEFDTVDGIKIMEKYKVSRTQSSTAGNQGKRVKKHSKLIDNQFKLHYDTSQLGKNLFKIKPESIISITWKLHGTSFVSSNVLCAKKLKWYERFGKFIGLPIIDTEYANLYSSRKVIKNDDLNKDANHYYGYDLWKDVNDEIYPNLLAGETVYGEIVGFTKEGGYIQKQFDYRCKPTEHDIYIYRITHTNIDGKIIDLPFNMVEERCIQLGIKSVPKIFFGRVKDFVNQFPTGAINNRENLTEEEFRQDFFDLVKRKYVYDQDSQFCKNKVPEEGIVVRIEGLKAEAFKLKSFKFLKGESDALDKGEVNIEDNE